MNRSSPTETNPGTSTSIRSRRVLPLRPHTPMNTTRTGVDPGAGLVCRSSNEILLSVHELPDDLFESPHCVRDRGPTRWAAQAWRRERAVEERPEHVFIFGERDRSLT